MQQVWEAVTESFATIAKQVCFFLIQKIHSQRTVLKYRFNSTKNTAVDGQFWKKYRWCKSIQFFLVKIHCLRYPQCFTLWTVQWEIMGLVCEASCWESQTWGVRFGTQIWVPFSRHSECSPRPVPFRPSWAKKKKRKKTEKKKNQLCAI